MHELGSGGAASRLVRMYAAQVRHVRSVDITLALDVRHIWVEGRNGGLLLIDRYSLVLIGIIILTLQVLLLT